jgi:hypothetical protein
MHTKCMHKFCTLSSAKVIYIYIYILVNLVICISFFCGINYIYILFMDKFFFEKL